MPSSVTTHVLDTSLGKPAVGVAVQFSRVSGDKPVVLGEALTDTDGRVGEGLIDADEFLPGTYVIRFSVQSYFAGLGTKSFYPEVAITFIIEKHEDHYHVPLLLSPFGYSTYRGS